MIKKSIVLIWAIAVFISLFASCKKEDGSSSLPSVSSELSSQITSSQNTSSAPNPQQQTKSILVKNSFLSIDAAGDIFYCGATGGIYRQLADGKSLSKVYSANGYEFFSVDCFEPDKICVGFRSAKFDSSYIIFNLKDKTVENAVYGDEFEPLNIFSLVHHKGSIYFLANPDRYNRYTLYKQSGQQTVPLASGVNEFFIYGDSVYYNVSNNIFSLNLAQEGAQANLVYSSADGYLVGFNIANDRLLYSTETDSFIVKLSSDSFSRLPQKLNAWTGSFTDTDAFFCGSNGGIYALSLETSILSKVSDYTAEDIKIIGDYLYLYPADKNDYPETEKELIISGGIYRFAVSDLLSQQNKDIYTSSSLSSSEVSSQLTSSGFSQPEVKPLVPEHFGR